MQHTPNYNLNKIGETDVINLSDFNDNADIIDAKLKSLETEVDAAKKSASDGKTTVAAAITAKGQATAADATFAEMATNIGRIETESVLTGTAAVSQVLSGATFYNTNPKNKLAGTIPSRGAATITPGKTAQTIASGQYLTGTQTIASLGGNAAANKVLAGSTFSSDAAGRGAAGTIATMGAQTVAPGNTQKVVPCSGKYMAGNVTVPAVSNLIAANIKKGVNVGGVIGTWEGYVASPADLYNNGAVGQWGITTNNTMESNCIKPRNGFIRTTSTLNWTGYKGISITFFSEGSGSGNIISLHRGASVLGDIVATSEKFTLAVGQWFTINITFRQNITDVMYIFFGDAGLGTKSYVTKISLY